jgi:Ni,Fe-hydrogenase III small subunit
MIRIIRQIFSAGIASESVEPSHDTEISLIGDELKKVIRKHFRGSLTIRQIDAGSCNGCELEIHAINNVFYNAERYGIHFTASPRFADMLLVTGPVSRNMEIALKRTVDSTPTPRLVVALGDCGKNGGIFGKSYAVFGGIEDVIHVDAVITGCPPTPEKILGGILEILMTASAKNK